MSDNQKSKLNCEVLHEDNAFEIRWSVVESGETIVFQLVGKIDDGNYMAFGLSGEDDRSVMIGGDAMIGWFDQATGRGNVVDYHLGGKSVCQRDSTSSCPDVSLKDGVNNVRLLSAATVNGFTILTFQRKLKALEEFDRSIKTNESQPVIWAIGPMENGLAGFHNIRSKDDFSIDFGRAPKWNCPEPEPEPEFAENSPSPTTILSTSTHQSQSTNSAVSSQKVESVVESPKEDSLPAASDHGSSYFNAAAWKIPPIPCSEPDDRIFYAQIGPSGRKEIFKGLTGLDEIPDNVWYINGLLMPEISLVRNKNYTFVIQGGDNPFYITSDSVGGTNPESPTANVYAGVGVDARGNNIPTTTGKLCRWAESGNKPAESFASYAAYQRSLTLDCKKGHSGVLQFTPDENTPNLVYYQSYSRGHLGWKIHIVDECETNEKVANEPHPIVDKDHSIPAAVPSQNLESDQNVGESINRDSVVTITHPNPGQKTNVNLSLRDVSQPVGSGHPVENAYIIDTSAGGGKVTFPNIVPLDTTRLIFNGKPVEPVTQGPSLSTRQGQIVAVPQGGTFQFPQNPGVYQIAIDPTGGENGARAPQTQSVYAPSGYQVSIPGDGHLLRRTGSPQIQVSNPYKITKYGERPEVIYESKPEYYIGANRQPLLSHPIRYDGVPAHSQQIIYATTMSPQRHNSPMGYIPHDKNSDYSELSMRMPGPGGPIVRVQNIPRREMQQMVNPENVNVKYIEYPHSGILLQQNDGRPNGPHAWAHSRNLPKRDYGRQEPPVFFNKEFIRGALRRDSRNDNLHDQAMPQPQQKLSPQTHTRSSESRVNSPQPPVVVPEDSNGRKAAVKSTKVPSDSSLVRGSSSSSNGANEPKEEIPVGGLESIGCIPNGPESSTCVPERPSNTDQVEDGKVTKGEESVQRSQINSDESLDKNDDLLDSEEAMRKVSEPVFESFGPVFRPSPVDSEGFNISKEFGQQNYVNHQSFLVEKPKRKYDFEIPSRSIDEPRLNSPFIPFLRRSPSKIYLPPRNEYIVPKPQRPFSPQHNSPSTSSTFHDIIKLLVPGSRNNVFNKYDIKTMRNNHHPHHHHGAPLQPVQRFPFRQQLIQRRKDQVFTQSHLVPSFSLNIDSPKPIGAMMERRNGNFSRINNNNMTAKINTDPGLIDQLRKDEDSNSGIGGGSSGPMSIASDDSSSGNGATTSNNNGEKEGEDNLSLTLLTDVWQIINQQGISKPHQPPTKIQHQQQPQPSGKPGRQLRTKPMMMIRSQGSPTPAVILNPSYNNRYQREPFYSRGLDGPTPRNGEDLEGKGKESVVAGENYGATSGERNPPGNVTSSVSSQERETLAQIK